MRKLIYLISLGLVITMMVIIFRFSASPADDSSKLSGGICLKITRQVNNLFGLGWEEEEIEAVAETMEFPIRKCAHFLEYALLAFFLCFHVFAIEYDRGMELQEGKIAFGLSVIYAMTDEFHQYFVPGRACRLYDVGVDSLGAICGILVFLIVIHICTLIRNK